jgi:hypothetical protein
MLSLPDDIVYEISNHIYGAERIASIRLVNRALSDRLKYRMLFERSMQQLIGAVKQYDDNANIFAFKRFPLLIVAWKTKLNNVYCVDTHEIRTGVLSQYEKNMRDEDVHIRLPTTPFHHYDRRVMRAAKRE